MSRKFTPSHLCRIRSLVLFIIINCYFHFPCLSQTGSENAVRDRVFESALIKAYHENPRIYEAHKKALEGEWQASLQRFNLGADRTSYMGWRMLPDPINSLRELGLYEWEKRKQEYDIDKRREMRGDPKLVAEVARSIRKQMYSDRIPKHISETYEDTKLHEGSNKLPDPVALEGLKQEYPDLLEDLDKMGLTEEQKELFCSGKMTKKELMTTVNVKNETEYNHFVQNNFLVFPKADELPTRSDAASSKEKDKENKRVELAKHSKTVSDAEAKLYAGTAVLALIDPQTANKISRAGTAAIQVYEAVGSMVINGAIDPTGIGNIASGVGIVASLLDKTPSFNTVVVGMLSQILENQRLMLIKLNAIEVKVDILQANIDYLLRVTDYNHNQILNEITDIKKQLAGLEYTVLENRTTQKLISQEGVWRDLQRRKGALVLEFYNDGGSLAWQKRIDAIQNTSSSVDYATQQYFDKINSLLNEIAYFTTVQLEDDTYSTFTDHSRIEQLEVANIKLKSNTDINQLVGLLPSIGLWLNDHTKGPTPYVDYNDAYPGEKLDGKDLNVNIGNPAIFSFLLNEYIDLALYRPITRRLDSSIINDPNIGAFCSDFQNIKTAMQKMRKHVPLALAVFNFHLKRLKNAQESFVLNHSNIRNITKTDANGKKTIYYAGMLVDSIEKELAKLSDDEFLSLCDSMQVIKKDSVIIGNKTRVVEASPMNGGVTETVMTSHWYIELKNEMRDKYKFKDRHEYIKSTYIYYSRYKGHRMGERHKTEKISNPRAKFNNVIAREIYERQIIVSQEWQRELINNQRLYLADVLRANLIVRTLVAGGYGHSYQLIGALKPLTETIRQIDEILDRIDHWSKGTQVFDDEKSMQLFSKYFESHSNLQTDPTGSNLKSVVVPINIPTDIDDPFFIEIGNFQNAARALRHASWYEDISPQKECLLFID